MQATVPSVQQGVELALEVQNRPHGVQVERIDPAILQLIAFLFPCQFEGMKFLALLCRRATEKQLAFYKEPVAVITFHGIAALCASPEWPWGYHATLRYFIIFQALGILTRARKNRITEVHIPLGIREEPLVRERLLQALGDLQKNKSKKHEYKDKKLVQLIARVKNHIEVYGLGTSGDSQKEMVLQLDPALLVPAQERLIEAMRAERIPVAKCKRIAQWMYTHEIPQLLRGQVYAGQLYLGDSQTARQERTGRYQCTLGDSERGEDFTNTQQQGDSQNTGGNSQNGSVSLQPGNTQTQPPENRPQNQQYDSLSDSSTLTEQPESPVLAHEVISHGEVGDSQGCLSSNTSILCNKISNRDSVDIEKAGGAALLQSPRSEASLLREATWIAIRLDGKESLKKNRGRGWVGAYKNKLLEHPYLVRCAMIDMFMQKAFPDWQGPPQKQGGLWFNRAYKAYALREEPVPSVIESWARSPYHYRQIEKALRRERKRQEEEIAELRRRNPFYAEDFVRPDASCVETYGLLRDEKVSLPFTLFEEDDAASCGTEEILADLCDEAAAESGQEPVVEMEDGACLTTEEYEQLEQRALEEERLRVEALIADPSLADLLADYVEQWVAAALATLPVPVFDDLQHLRAILDPEGYTVDVQVRVGDSYVIKVQSKNDPTNVCVLADPEQTQVFLRRFGQLPALLSQHLQHLWAILDPDLYLADVLLTLDGPYTIRVRARTNPSNACLLRGPGQIRTFIDWFTHLPAAVIDDLQHLRAILAPELYSVGVQLAPASRYVLLVWANDDPNDARALEGPTQTQEFIQWFTQEEATNPAEPAEG